MTRGRMEKSGWSFIYVYVRDQGPGQWPEIRDKGRQAPQSRASRQLHDIFSAFPFSRTSAWMRECRKDISRETRIE